MTCLKCGKKKKFHSCIDCHAEELFEARKFAYMLALKEIQDKADKNGNIILTWFELQHMILKEKQRQTW